MHDLNGISMSKHMGRGTTGVMKKIVGEISPRYVEMGEKIHVINCPFIFAVRISR